VVVDDAGREREPLRVDVLARRTDVRADRGNAASGDCEIRVTRRRTKAVVNERVANDEIVHRPVLDEEARILRQLLAWLTFG
jgi:hypothetical protein